MRIAQVSKSPSPEAELRSYSTPGSFHHHSGTEIIHRNFQTTAAFRPEMFVIKKEIVKSFPAWYIPRLPPTHHLSWISSAKQT